MSLQSLFILKCCTGLLLLTLLVVEKDSKAFDLVVYS